MLFNNAGCFYIVLYASINHRIRYRYSCYYNLDYFYCDGLVE